MKINIVIPAVDKKTFTGGILCLLNYANGLAKIGHEVNVVPFMISDSPDWFKEVWHFNFIHTNKLESFKIAFIEFLLFLPRLIINIISGVALSDIKNKNLVRSTVGAISSALSCYSTLGARHGGVIDNLLKLLPEADATIATDAETAYAVAWVGTGERFYFSQHYEPLFWKERMGGLISKTEAEISYRLGLRQIVNSPWLGQHLMALACCPTYDLSPNAIDHDTFNGEPKKRVNNNSISIISYGGREAEWKGFREMCEAMRIARAKNPGIEFKWQVYGRALLPADNTIASYEALGFLNSAQLARAYRENDVLLSASWYESFPLFPLEAMACGLATITTPIGTELYAEDKKTALLVEPKNPQNIAEALVCFAKNENLRLTIANAGNKKAKDFTWNSSIKKMAQILETACHEKYSDAPKNI